MNPLDITAKQLVVLVDYLSIEDDNIVIGEDDAFKARFYKAKLDLIQQLVASHPSNK